MYVYLINHSVLLIFSLFSLLIIPFVNITFLWLSNELFLLVLFDHNFLHINPSLLNISLIILVSITCQHVCIINICSILILIDYIFIINYHWYFFIYSICLILLYLCQYCYYLILFLLMSFCFLRILLLLLLSSWSFLLGVIIYFICLNFVNSDNKSFQLQDRIPKWFAWYLFIVLLLLIVDLLIRFYFFLQCINDFIITIANIM